MASPAPPPTPPAVPSAEAPRALSLVPLATGVVAVGALYLAKDVLVPIVLAVLLAFVVAPLVGLLRRLWIGRTLSVVIAMLIALAVVGLTGTVIGQQAAGLAPDLPKYAERIQKKVRALGQSSVGTLPDQLTRVARRFDTANQTPPAPRLARRARPIPVEVHEPPESGLQTARRLLGPVVEPLETFVIVLVVAIFVLLQREDLRDRVIRLFGSSDLHRTTRAIDEAAGRLSRYFLTQLLLNALFGGVIALGLYWIGIPSPLLWGLLATLMRFVPYVGAFLAALPPLLIAIGGEPGWTTAIMVGGLFLITEPIMGYVVEPLVYGHSTGLSPLAVIVAAIFWTWLWGPIGLLLSTPITLCLVVLGRHVPQMEFIDVLFGDRPALTPVESFYQRMLAGDADEVQDQAEQLLKDRPLSAYYDAVVVPGLRLALADRRRGTISRECLDGIVEQTRELVQALDGHDDDDVPDEDAPAEPAAPSLAEQALPAASAPAASPRGASVLCLSGPGPADPAVAAVVAQLLEKHGHRIIEAEDGAADSSAPDILCLVGAELRPSSPRWRGVEARARQRWPEARIVRGLLRPNRTADAPCCTSLKDLVEACGS
ncbi:AI-2E family transporter [Sphingomonas sp. ID1715]|uniref:AI-2E family transporter n=1 Tax=Sphingomonas sp. ID1715 TaxID=1656898 RepID=UPI001489B454|nr:AI-2E family transporter [Sphingomonas sp. ID1715]NNM78694.1 AI-2E family transporter [Sphingomonas sp. ID1715]